jgi:2-dehydro-3-deoxygluconokinase
MITNGKIVTFGELMLRFSKPDKQRLSQGKMFCGNYGGSEANVAVSLAMQGENVEYVTRLPSTQTGRAGAMKLSELGVDTTHILYGGDRIGVYYFEEAAGLRNAGVTYDRQGSAYYYLRPGMIDWQHVLQGASVLVVSGITAAISQDAADATFEALDAAKAMGINISLDLNYRKNLWRYQGAEPRQTLLRMMQYADVMFGDVIEYEFVSQHPKIPFLPLTPDYDMQLHLYRQWYQELQPLAPRCRKMMIGMRNELSSNHHLLTGLLWADGQMYNGNIVDIPNVVDPMGVGDAFVGGFLHALRLFDDDDNQHIIDYALAAASLKNTISGDFNLSTEEEILDVMNSHYAIKDIKIYD